MGERRLEELGGIRGGRRTLSGFTAAPDPELIVESLKDLLGEALESVGGLEEEEKREVGNALDRIAYHIERLKAQNTRLRGSINTTFTDEPIDLRKTLQQGPIIISDEKSYLKAKFILLKCKELYNLLKEYDSPSEEIRQKKTDFEARMVKRVRSFGEVASALLTDGVLEDISTKMTEICATKSKHRDKLSHDIATYVSWRLQSRFGDKKKETPRQETITEKKHLKRMDLRIWDSLRTSRHCKKTEDSQTENDKIEEDVPTKVIKNLFTNHPNHIAKEVKEFLEKATLGDEKIVLESSRIGFANNIVRKNGLEINNDTVKEIFCKNDQDLSTISLIQEEQEIEQVAASRIITEAFPYLKTDPHNDRSRFIKTDNDSRLRKFAMRNKEDDTLNIVVDKGCISDEKRKHQEPTGKTKSQLISRIVSSEDRSTDINMKFDEEIKKYMDIFARVKMESMNRFGSLEKFRNERSPFRFGLETNVRVRIPLLSHQVLEDRLAERIAKLNLHPVREKSLKNLKID